jgi:hypothetical protein
LGLCILYGICKSMAGIHKLKTQLKGDSNMFGLIKATL